MTGSEKAFQGIRQLIGIPKKCKNRHPWFVCRFLVNWDEFGIVLSHYGVYFYSKVCSFYRYSFCKHIYFQITTPNLKPGMGGGPVYTWSWFPSVKLWGERPFRFSVSQQVGVMATIFEWDRDMYICRLNIFGDRPGLYQKGKPKWKHMHIEYTFI